MVIGFNNLGFDVLKITQNFKIIAILVIR